MIASVYKYEIGQPRAGVSWIEVPSSAQLLSVGEQDGKIFVWALINVEDRQYGLGLEEQGVLNQMLLVVNTGQTFEINVHADSKDRFLGTVTVEGIVWHIWDCGGYPT